MATDQNSFNEIEAGSEPGAAPSLGADVTSEIEAGSGLAEPTFGEKATEAAIGTAEGAVTGSITLGSGLKGGQYGARLGAAFPVLGPYTPVVGGTLGFLGGVTAGYLASQPIEEWFPIPSREDLVPYREGGRTFGGSIGAAPIAYSMPVMSANKVARFLSNIGEAARARPGTFLAAETSAGATSGIAGGTAVYYDPESAKTRFAAELAGGLFAPGKMFINGTSMTKDFLTNFASSFSQDARQAKAANVLRAALEEGGEDVDAVIRALRQITPVDPVTGETIKLTAGQKTGVPVLNALEATLASRHAKYSGATREQGEKALQAYKLLIQQLENIGDPAAVRKAAEMRDDYLNQLMEARLNAAHADAAVKISRISRGDTPGVRREIGQIVKTEVDGALDEARAFEKQLWDNAYKSSFKRESGYVIPGSPVPLKMVKEGSRKGMVDMSEEIDYTRPDFRMFTKDKAGNIVMTTYDTASPQFKAFEQALDGMPVNFNPATDLGSIPRKQTVLPTKTFITPKSVDTNNLFSTYLDFVSGMTPERLQYRVPKEVKSIMERIGISPADLSRYQKGKMTEEFFDTGVVPKQFLPNPADLDKLPVDQLVKIRSDLLAFARDAAAKGEASDASFYGRLAEAALADLSKLSTKEYDQARNFSRALNDTFTRTFAGETQAVKGTGAEKLPAEILVSRAFGRNADVTAMRMDQMEDAAGFLRSQYEQALKAYGPRNNLTQSLKMMVPFANNRIQSIADAQERVMRVAAANAIDLNTGRLNVNRLINFAKENKPMLDKLGITKDLEDAAVAENAFKAIQDQNSVINQKLRKQTAFGQVLEFENPTKAVTSALNSKFPVKNFNRMMRMAKAGGQDAIDGMKSTVYDYIYTKSMGKNGMLDPQALEDAMFAPIAPNQPSIYNIMRSQGMMTVSEAKNLKRLIDPMKRVQQSLERGQSVDEIVAGANPVTDLALRIIGAKIGTTAAQGGPGSLIAASAGSKYVRSIFDKMPQLSVTRLIEDATRDPQLMAQLLAKGQTPQQKVKLARSLHSYLTAAGYNYADYEEPPALETVPSPVTGPTAAQMLRQVAPRQLPPAPPTRGVPGLTGQKPAGGPTPPAAGGPQPPNQSRAMLQSLFPFDTTLSVGLPRQ